MAHTLEKEITTEEYTFCSVRNCKYPFKLNEPYYIAGMNGIHKGKDVIQKRKYCKKHAESFAEKYNLQLP